MGAATALAAGASRSRLLRPWLAALGGCLAAVFLVLLVGVFGAVFGLKVTELRGYRPSGLARTEIPPLYLRLYQEIGERYGLDPCILAGIGWVETQHGQSGAPGVHSGRNAYGCCAGPMQISLDGTWQRFRVDGDGDGRTSVYA